MGLFKVQYIKKIQFKYFYKYLLLLLRGGRYEVSHKSARNDAGRNCVSACVFFSAQGA